jgi:5-methylcytosine-specific restriction enzyme subunit McrC
MERIFEDYIGSVIKKYLSDDYDITLQDREFHLINDEKKFRLIPDIILKKRGNGAAPIIADTKWKLLDENNYKNNYNISQADLYQMYAYAKKYQASKIVLIYPNCETFTKKIDTLKQYEEGIEISVVPFDLSTILNEQELEIEVQNILNY